jgi:hypothetical protein
MNLEKKEGNFFLGPYTPVASRHSPCVPGSAWAGPPPITVLPDKLFIGLQIPTSL